MEERYHTTTQNWFYPNMSNVNKNITVETKLISPPTYIVICRLTLTYFSTLYNKRHDFRRKVIEHELCFDILYKFLYEIFHILRRIKRDIILNVHRSACKVPVILVRFKRNLNFPNIFAKNAQISNPIKIFPLGSELLHAHGRMDQHDEANHGFSQFCERA